MTYEALVLSSLSVLGDCPFALPKKKLLHPGVLWKYHMRWRGYWFDMMIQKFNSIGTLLPKQKSAGPMAPIIVFKFYAGVCLPNRIMLSVRLTSTLSYVKGQPSLQPVRLHLSSSFFNRAPKRVHPPRAPKLLPSCILHPVFKGFKSAHSHANWPHRLRRLLYPPVP